MTLKKHGPTIPDLPYTNPTVSIPEPDIYNEGKQRKLVFSFRCTVSPRLFNVLLVPGNVYEVEPDMKLLYVISSIPSGNDKAYYNIR